MGTFNTGNALCRTGSTVAASSNASGNFTWSNPGNITLDDGTFATSTDSGGGSVTNWLVGSNFGFNIPTESKILASLVQVRAGSSGTFIEILGVTMALNSDDVNPFNAPQFVVSPSTGTLYTFGTFGYSGISTFGLNLTPYNVNNPDFQARLQGLVTGGTLFVDAIWASIIYTDNVTSASGNTQIRVQTRMAGY